MNAIAVSIALGVQQEHASRSERLLHPVSIAIPKKLPSLRSLQRLRSVKGNARLLTGYLQLILRTTMPNARRQR